VRWASGPQRGGCARPCAACLCDGEFAGVEVDVDVAGHADINITADAYTTVLHELELASGNPPKPRGATAEAAANLIPRQASNRRPTQDGGDLRPVRFGAR
jgi:hypothetical protein